MTESPRSDDLAEPILRATGVRIPRSAPAARRRRSSDPRYDFRMEHTGIEIPPERLEADTLRRLIEEFVTRASTDDGIEVPLEAKVRDVMLQLRRGTAVILFDPATESCVIVPRI